MSGRAEQIMWAQLFQLSSKSTLSLQHQIRETLVAAILDGRLSADTPIPSSRELARQLGVARNTVLLAYQHLVDEYYLIARERSGYFVNPAMSGHTPTPHESRYKPKGSARIDWGRRLRVRPSGQRNIVKRANWREFEYPFIYGQPDPSHFPLNDWRECFRQALSVQSVSTLVRDQLDADDPLLVEQIQSRVLPRRGVWAESEEILITLGAQNALYILAALLIGAETVVGIEDPGYPDARNIFAMRSNHLRPLPIDEGGLVIGEHLRCCDYIFVTPSHQSPTTVTMPLARRRELLRIASESDIVLIEDDYESEIQFDAAPTPALKGLDTGGRVLHIGSLSKTLDPGLRIGFLTGPEPLVREARALRRLMLRHPAANNQHAVALFLSLGHHDSLIQRMTQAYRERWEAMGNALDHYLPLCSRPASWGGSSYWIEGPLGLDSRALARRAAAHSIFLEPGDINFFTEQPPTHFFRLGFSAIPAERIEPGIAGLSRLMGEHLERAEPAGTTRE